MKTHKFVFLIMLAALFAAAFARPALAVRQSDQPPAGDLDLPPDLVAPDADGLDLAMAAIMRMDGASGAMMMWFTPEIGAMYAYADQGPDAMMGYYFIELLTSDHLVFSLMNMAAETTDLAAPPVLKNSAGVSVPAMDAHPSFEALMPGLVIFPLHDAKGKPVLGPDVKSISITLNVKDQATPTVLTWDLPLQYPAVIDQAKAWVGEQARRDPATLSEDEFIFSSMTPTFRMDVPTGLLVALMPQDLFLELLAKDPDMKSDALASQVAEQIIKANTMFLIVSMDQEINPERVSQAAASASAVNTAGQTVPLNTQAMETLFKDVKRSTSDMGEILIFKDLGVKGVIKLTLKDPQTGKFATFQWENAK